MMTKCSYSNVIVASNEANVCHKQQKMVKKTPMQTDVLGEYETTLV